MTDEEYAKLGPLLSDTVLRFAMEMCPDPTRAACVLLVAAHALTTLYPTPSFHELVELVAAAAPDVPKAGGN